MAKYLRTPSFSKPSTTASDDVVSRSRGSRPRSTAAIRPPALAMARARARTGSLCASILSAKTGLAFGVSRTSGDALSTTVLMHASQRPCRLGEMSWHRRSACRGHPRSRPLLRLARVRASMLRTRLETDRQDCERGTTWSVSMLLRLVTLGRCRRLLLPQSLQYLLRACRKRGDPDADSVVDRVGDRGCGGHHRRFADPLGA